MTQMRVIKDTFGRHFRAGDIVEAQWRRNHAGDIYYPWGVLDDRGRTWWFREDELKPVPEPTPVPVQVTVDGLTPEAVREIVRDVLREHGLLPTEVVEDDPTPEPEPEYRTAYVKVLDDVWEHPAAPKKGDIVPMQFLPERVTYPWRFDPSGQDWFYSETEVREVDAVRLTKDVPWTKHRTFRAGSIGVDRGPSPSGEFREVWLPAYQEEALLWPNEIEPAVP